MVHGKIFNEDGDLEFKGEIEGGIRVHGKIYDCDLNVIYDGPFCEDRPDGSFLGEKLDAHSEKQGSVGASNQNSARKPNYVRNTEMTRHPSKEKLELRNNR